MSSYTPGTILVTGGAETSRLDRYWMGNLEAALEAGTQKDSRMA